MSMTHVTDNSPAAENNRTVMDEDLELSVEHDAHGILHLNAAWPEPDDDWQFTPEEARELARVLNAHADAAENGVAA